MLSTQLVDLRSSIFWWFIPKKTYNLHNKLNYFTFLPFLSISCEESRPTSFWFFFRNCEVKMKWTSFSIDKYSKQSSLLIIYTGLKYEFTDFNEHIFFSTYNSEIPHYRVSRLALENDFKILKWMRKIKRDFNKDKMLLTGTESPSLNYTFLMIKSWNYLFMKMVV